MKPTLFLSATVLLCLGSVISSALPTRSEPLPVNEQNETTELEEVPHPTPQTADLLLVEPRGLDSLTDENTDAFNAVANQINQGIDNDSDEFLPEGMVVRGSEGSLQLGSEF